MTYLLHLVGSLMFILLIADKFPARFSFKWFGKVVLFGVYINVAARLILL